MTRGLTLSFTCGVCQHVGLCLVCRLRAYSWLEVTTANRDAFVGHDACKTKRYGWEHAPSFF